MRRKAVKKARHCIIFLSKFKKKWFTVEGDGARRLRASRRLDGQRLRLGGGARRRRQRRRRVRRRSAALGGVGHFRRRQRRLKLFTGPPKTQRKEQKKIIKKRSRTKICENRPPTGGRGARDRHLFLRPTTIALILSITEKVIGFVKEKKNPNHHRK